MNKLPFLVLIILFSSDTFCRTSVSSAIELNRLFKTFDMDNDKKITIEDKIASDAVFELKSDTPLRVKGLYQLSNLAQELKYSDLTGRPLDESWIFIDPVERISRSIRERYWDGLTRRIDESTIDEVIKDPKVKNKKKYLYVPASDLVAFSYYKKLKRKNLEVRLLPSSLPSRFIANLGSEQGLLTLALEKGEGVPYVVPGGRFNEMYGWDSYFHALGVIEDGRTELARAMVDNFVYEINHYGKILNANRSYYLTRSQPPFLTSMIRAVIETQEKVDLNWLSQSLLAALKEYHEVWMGKDRLTETGLNRYAGFDEGIPPEVEDGHFDHILGPYAKKYKLPLKRFITKFNSGEIHDEKLVDFFHQDRAVRESGHDTTYRWRVDKEDRASDFVTVDLNSLLLKYEKDLEWLISKFFNGNFKNYKSAFFKESAEKRKNLMLKLLWNPEKKLFYDYNFMKKSQSHYLSATTFYPLWASTDILTKKEAKDFVTNALRKLEEEGGVAATARESLEAIGDKKNERQWEYPYGWAPHQIITWAALDNYGLQEEKLRLVYKWLYMITKNASEYNGTIPEKFNVSTLSHKVFAEYGNVGTKFSYITLEGFGWMNASYQIGKKLLPPEMLSRLKKLETYHQPKPLR